MCFRVHTSVLFVTYSVGFCSLPVKHLLSSDDPCDGVDAELIGALCVDIVVIETIRNESTRTRITVCSCHLDDDHTKVLFLEQ